MTLEMEQILKGVKGIEQSENQRLKMASKLSSKWEVEMGRQRSANMNGNTNVNEIDKFPNMLAMQKMYHMIICCCLP